LKVIVPGKYDHQGHGTRNFKKIIFVVVYKNFKLNSESFGDHHVEELRRGKYVLPMKFLLARQYFDQCHVLATNYVLWLDE